MMGFPEVPFRLCDFWAIHSEVEKDGVLVVRGELPGVSPVATVAIAKFARQPGPQGSWKAFSLEQAK